MLEPVDVSAMLRLNELGWGAKRIARELGVSRNTVKDYIAAGGWTPYRHPARKKVLDGLEGWLRERLRRHRGNADVIRPGAGVREGNHHRPSDGGAGSEAVPAGAGGGSASNGAL